MGLLIVGSLQEGLGYAILALGVFITFRLLDLPDLTVDGSFGLGMAVSVVMAVAGHPVAALFVAAAAGAAAGTVTGLLQTKVKIHPILAGILTMNGLYTINLVITGGKSNISLSVAGSVFTMFSEAFGAGPDTAKLIVPAVICVIMVIALAVFFKTRPGIAIRATGDNEAMVRASSINADFCKCAGLALGNACVAVAGAVIGQSMAFFDVSFGIGMVIVGLASVIIGETIVGHRGVTAGLLCAVLGAVIYRLFIAAALKVELFPAYGLKLVSAVIVTAALALPVLQEWRKHKKLLKQEGRKGNA